MKRTFIFNLAPMHQHQRRQFIVLLAFVLLFSLVVQAQDAAITPANDHTKIAWINGGTQSVPFTGTVIQTSSGWINPENVVNNITADYGHIVASGNTFPGGLLSPSGTMSIGDGNTYSTNAFTGYYIGFLIDRAVTRSATTVGATFSYTISTYLGANPTGESASGNTFTTDIGAYFHKPFNNVRLTVSGSFPYAFSAAGNSTAEIRVKNAYLQRYTRGAGGTSGVEATCNAQVPLTGRAITANGVSTGLGLPPYIVPALPWMIEAIEDTDPATHAIFPMITTFFALGTRYEGSVKDEAVVYPAGTYAGFKLTVGAGFGTNAADIRTLNLKRNGTVVSSTTSLGLAGAAVLSSDGSTTIGMIATEEFDEIEYSITTLLSPTPGASAVEVHYPIIQRFCNEPITCTSPPAPVGLKKGVQGGATNYPVWVKAVTPVSIGTLNGSIKDVDNVIDDDPDNYALISQLISGITDYGISVNSEEENGYPAGTYVGFEVEDVDVVSAGAAIVHTISTYLNGNPVQSFTDGTVAGGKVFNTTGRNLVGFKATSPFDEVRISITSAASGGLYGTRVYKAVIESFCASTGPEVCNEVVPLTRPAYAAYVDATNTGINSAASVQNTINHTERLIDGDLTNYATITTLASGTVNASVAVQNGGDVYPIGTFAGFDISNPNLAGGGFLNNVEISTLDAAGGVVETVDASGSLFAIGSSLLTGTGRQTIGFLATQPFTGVKLTFKKTVAGELGEIRVYNAVTETFCIDEALVCDELTPVTNPGFPVYVDSRQTGFFGVASAGNSINNSQNAIDASPNTFASVTLGATLGTTASFAVANAMETYPAETYAGFDIGSVSLFNAGVLSSMAITLYNDGSAVQNSTGTALLGGVTSSLVTDGYNRNVVGVVSRVPFDEVKITFANGAAVDLGVIRIYGAVFQQFLKADGTLLCPVVIECNKNIVLGGPAANPASTKVSAVVNYERTGVTGVAAAGYDVANPWNVVSEDITDFATIYNAASGGAQASLSVATPGVVYPAGTFAGFTIKKTPSILAAALFPQITITTYLKGSQREVKTGSALADFTLFTQWFGTPTDFYNPGFKTTLTFDEIRITVASLASFSDHHIDVYGAYVDTRESTPIPEDGSTVISCLPDLTPTITLNNANFASSGTQKNFVVNIFELLGVSTSSAIAVQVSVAPGYELLDFSPGLTSVNVSGAGSVSVQNSNWTLYSTPNVRTKVFTSANGFTLNRDDASLGQSSFGLSLKRVSASSGSTGNITVTIITDPSKTYDSNFLNNVFVRVLTSN